MSDLLEEVLRVVLVAEKRGLELYRQAAPRLNDEGKRVVERLAAKELDAVARIVERLPLDPSDLQTAQGGESCGLPELTQPDLHLPEVLQLALQEKSDALVKYQACLDAFREPAICEALQLAAALTLKLSAAITEEWHLAMQRLQRPLPDRHSKRAHIRNWLIKPAPNQHSQLSISLRDVGRRYPY